MSDTPELDKQAEVIRSGKAELIQEFIDWLGVTDRAVVGRCGPHSSTWCDRCEGSGYTGRVYDFEALMAEFFGIDRGKIEQERRLILDRLREAQSVASNGE